MTRKDFLKLLGILGTSLPALSMFSSCDKKETFSGRVLIIGAGVAGLSAGHLLKQRGIDFQIIEASSNYGGRLKINRTFADFPIPLGAEWLHVGTDTFTEIVNDNTTSVHVNTVKYNTGDSYGLYENGVLTLDTIGNSPDRKFVGGSWLDFFEAYIVPSVSDEIVYDSIVESIDYAGEEIVVTTQNGTFNGNKVIVTAPLKILQKGSISFNPVLPSNKSDAINNATVWDGIKLFFEFSSVFYPTITDVTIPSSDDGEITIFDAAYGQNTTKNILSIFALGSASQPYISRSGNNLRDFALSELDRIFSNQASPNYVKHIALNWSSQAYIEGAYLSDNETSSRVATLFESVHDKIYFAGEAYTSGNDWGGVHAAAQAAKDVVNSF